MAETVTGSDSARLEQLERKISELQAFIEKMNKETHSITVRAAKRQELGLKIEEREVILEKRRMAEAVQEFGREHPQEFDLCPLCLEKVISIHDIDSAILFTCCGQTSSRCYDEDGEQKETSSRLRNKCPLCRSPFPTSRPEANEPIRRLAEKGNAWAQYDIAESYHSQAKDAASDESKKELDQKALLWHCWAAENGCSLSELKVACRYLNEGGYWTFPEPADPSEGMRWLVAASNHGNALAQELLGHIYYHDYDDMEMAIYWCTLAAANGQPVSRLHFGFCFFRGLGELDKNLERAKYHLESKEVVSLSGKMLGSAQSELASVLADLAVKRYGPTLLWVPGHDCIFEVVSLSRKAIENGDDSSKDLLEYFENGRKFFLNCQKSQDDMSTPLLRCTRCKLVK